MAARKKKITAAERASLEAWLAQLGIPVQVFEADWHTFGRAAGPHLHPDSILAKFEGFARDALRAEGLPEIYGLVMIFEDGSWRPLSAEERRMKPEALLSRLVRSEPRRWVGYVGELVKGRGEAFYAAAVLEAAHCYRLACSAGDSDFAAVQMAVVVAAAAQMDVAKRQLEELASHGRKVRAAQPRAASAGGKKIADKYRKRDEDLVRSGREFFENHPRASLADAGRYLHEHVTSAPKPARIARILSAHIRRAPIGG